MKSPTDLTFEVDGVAGSALVDGAGAFEATAGPVLSRTVEREKLRKRMLEAVAHLHGAGGYQAVTMRAVAKEVGMSPMSLYRYFPNKAALLGSVWFQLLDEALDAARATDELDTTPAIRLRNRYAAYVGFWLERPQDFRLLFDPSNEVPASLVQAGPAQRFRREIESLIDACLGPDADIQQRELAYDLCRAKVVGLLYTCIGMETKANHSPQRLLDVLLDDIDRQLQAR